MKHTKARTVSELRQRLRANDPAQRQQSLSDDQVASMRSRVVAEAQRKSTQTRQIPALQVGAPQIATTQRGIAVIAAAATVLLLAASAVVWQSRGAAPTGIGATEIGASGIGASEVGASPQATTTAIAARSRQVQFVAPGGTRVVWLLTSEFSIDQPQTNN